MSIFSLLKKPEVFHSTINGIISIGSSYGKKALFVGHVPQSGGEFIHMWDSVIATIKKRGFTPRSVLVLGVAGGTVLTSLQNYYPEVTITAVEIDPVIITASKKYFGLHENRNTTIIIGDAISWVKKPGTKRFDLIVVDLYIGLFNPLGARKAPFIGALKKSLKEKGLCIYNCDYQQEDTEKYVRFKKLCQTKFKSVEEIFSYKFNRILLIGNHWPIVESR